MGSTWAAMVVVGALALTACGKGEKHDDDGRAPAGFTPPVTQAPTALPGQAGMPVTAHVGKYPSDAIGGVGFYDRTDVSHALHDAVGDERIVKLVIGRSGPQTPIFVAKDGRIAAWGCEQHNCGDHNWTFLFDEKPGKSALCYHEDGKDSRWYMGAAAVRKPGGCPSEAGAV